MRLFATIAGTRRLCLRVWPLMRHARVPLALKLGTLFAALLIVSPLDIFGDIPVLGVLDDAMLLALLATLFVSAGNWLLTRDARQPIPVRARVSPPLALIHR